MINRVILIVLDGFGVGEAPDAYFYEDVGSNTLKGIYNNTKLEIPNMKRLGLYNIQDIGINKEQEKHPIGSYGKAREQAVRKK